MGKTVKQRWLVWEGRAHGVLGPWARGPVRTGHGRGHGVVRDYAGARAHGVWGSVGTGWAEISQFWLRFNG